MTIERSSVEILDEIYKTALSSEYRLEVAHDKLRFKLQGNLVCLDRYYFLWNINLYQNVSTLRQLARIVPLVRLISLMAYTVNTMAADALTTQWAKTSKLSIPSFLYTIRRNTWRVKTNIIISGNYNDGVNSYLFPQDWRSPVRPHIAIYITSTTRSFNLLSRFCEVHVISQNMHRGYCVFYIVVGVQKRLWWAIVIYPYSTWLCYLHWGKRIIA